jgi:hypothetical protein
MNYFTPELLKRYGSLDDDFADAAAVEWEKVSKAYRKHFSAIKPNLPRNVRGFVRKYYMHDARLMTMAFGDERRYITFLFQLSGRGRRALQLTYWLVGKQEVIMMERSQSVEVEWLYDEIELVKGPTPVFRHCILMTGGVEFRLTFSKLDVFPFQELSTTPRTDAKVFADLAAANLLVPA